jgi:hypothetical protein
MVKREREWRERGRKKREGSKKKFKLISKFFKNFES